MCVVVCLTGVYVGALFVHAGIFFCEGMVGDILICLYVL